MLEKVHKLLKALLCKVESYTHRVESLEDCCKGMDYDYIRRDGDSMRGPLRFEQGVFFDDLSSTFNGNLDIGDLTENVTWTLPGSSGTIALLDDLFTCEDLENCQEIIDIKDSIPTDVSDLTDVEELLFSGDYNDLDNKPTIPTVPVQSVNGKTGTVVINKTDVGLSNVDNTSDLAKPISTATQSALDDKADTDGGNATGDLATTIANSHTHTNKSILDATTASYTTAEKNKLAGIEAGAQVNVKADWNATSGDAEILNKPNTFTPSGHTHPISDIIGLQAELNTKLESVDLDGFIYDVQYNSSIHTITFYQQNGPSLVIDLPIEQLIKGVQLVGNDLVFTFEDESTVTVPLNTLLVGVIKSVNGLTPNSQGEIILNVADIPNLSNALNNKQDTLVSGVNIKTIDGQSLLGTGDIPIPPGLSLGETSSTAYRGDRGKIAYDHSQLTNGNPHNVTKTDVGLSNVDNTSDANKPISTATQNALNGKEDSSNKVNNLNSPNNTTYPTTLAVLNAINSTPSSMTITPKTYAELENLKTSKSLVPGVRYFITDRNIWIDALDINRLAMECKRHFRVVKDEFYTPHTVSGSTISEYLGIYGQTYDRGSVPNSISGITPTNYFAIWGGRMWLRRVEGTDIPGSSNEIIQSGWTMQSPTNDTYYESKVFNIKYDFDEDIIWEQSDDRGNKIKRIDSTISLIDITDWGNVEIYNNENQGIYNNFRGSNKANIYNNLNNGRIYNNTNNGSIFTNLNLGDIQNNSNIGDIRFNANKGSISNNSNNGHISSNSNINILDNSNNGHISLNSNLGSILNNSNIGNIENNSNSGVIQYNSNTGGISSNSNTGGITYNSNSSGITHIRFNRNNGFISRNNMNGSYLLQYNTNNGNIGNILSPTTRNADITDNVINKN